MNFKQLIYGLIVSLVVVGCTKYDDTKLWNSIDGLTNRVERLEQKCDKMNENIVALQIVVQALQTNDGIKSLTSLPNGEGYSITFASGKTINIYNGKDGHDGTNGKDGETPEIYIKKDTDGIYYWTVNGEWLIVDGMKVRAAADNGKDGTDGRDGTTPQFKIEDGYWFISYDGRENWEKLGKATGDNGLNGENGESIFKRVVIKDGYVQFTLNDGDSTVIKLPFASDTTLTVNVEKAGTLRELLTDEQKRTVSHLIVKGEVNEDDLKYMNLMDNLNYLDLKDTKNWCSTLNPFGNVILNRTFRTVILAKKIKSREVDFRYCLNLKKLVVNRDSSFIKYGKNIMNFSLDTLMFSEGITTIADTTPGDAYISPDDDSTLTKFRVNILPSTLEFISYQVFSQNYSEFKRIIIICKAQTPPQLFRYKGWNPTVFSGSNGDWDIFTLYVPEQSVEAYRTAIGWKIFPNILPIEGNIDPESINY